ncbi:MAG TPA: hypothetical protein VGF55_27575 [Gemmataceae bacterium]|jgi:hypothetical protein
MNDEERADLEQVEYLHHAAKACQRRLEWLHNFTLRVHSMTADQRRQNAVYPNFIAPLAEVRGWLAKDPAALTYLALMTETRSRLGMLTVCLGTVRAANAHELALQASLFFIRIWNQFVRPDLPDISPNPHAEDWNKVEIHPPPPTTRPYAGNVFCALLGSLFTTFNPRELDSQLKLEHAAAADILHVRWAEHRRIELPDNTCALKLHKGWWKLRYNGESGSYKAKGNQCITWLAKLLAGPNRMYTVAQLRGDPEGKLAADALIGNERETDHEGEEAIKRRLEDLEEIISDTGGTEVLQAEMEDLIASLQRIRDARTLGTPLKRAHANMATQLRTFRTKKLATDMPQLAAHLHASLKMELPEFGYYPPEPAPAWQF